MANASEYIDKRLQKSVTYPIKEDIRLEGTLKSAYGAVENVQQSEPEP